MVVEKVCPVIIREIDGIRQILVFHHPSAGIQTVKGTLEADESPADGAIRELEEESGISSVTSADCKGTWFVEQSNQLWHFFVCTTSKKLADQWDFFTLDDGGLTYSFFWFDVNGTPDDHWHPVYQNALERIRSFV